MTPETLDRQSWAENGWRSPVRDTPDHDDVVLILVERGSIGPSLAFGRWSDSCRDDNGACWRHRNGAAIGVGGRWRVLGWQDAPIASLHAAA